MRLTGRGIAALAVAAVLLAAGLIGGYAFFAVLGVVLLAALAAAVVVAAQPLRVEVQRSVYPRRVQRGRPALGRLQVNNPTARRQGGFFATDRVGGQTETVRARALPPGAQVSYHYELPTTQRGRLTVGPLVLHRTDPFGLAGSRASAGEAATLIVHPRCLPARLPLGGNRRHHHEGRIDEMLHGSLDLRDVREYVIGDEVRHLHWKATARTGRLMVRRLADPEQPRFTVLLDDRASALSPAEFEEAVDTAASLLAVSATAGQPTRLVTACGVDLITPGGYPAHAGLLDELCELGQQPGGDDPVPLALSAGPPGGGLAVVTSARVGTRSLAQLPRRFTGVVAALISGESQRVEPADGLLMLTGPTAEDLIAQWNRVTP